MEKKNYLECFPIFSNKSNWVANFGLISKTSAKIINLTRKCIAYILNKNIRKNEFFYENNQ